MNIHSVKRQTVRNEKRNSSVSAIRKTALRAYRGDAAAHARLSRKVLQTFFFLRNYLFHDFRSRRS